MDNYIKEKTAQIVTNDLLFFSISTTSHSLG